MSKFKQIQKVSDKIKHTERIIKNLNDLTKSHIIRANFPAILNENTLCDNPEIVLDFKNKCLDYYKKELIKLEKEFENL